jgi:(1->4)-alpha-D-glucan 1-alpha-D-glucosylmutase
VRTFLSRLLDAQANAPFVDDCGAFANRLAHFGMLNSLSQTLLKIVSPGVPDTYQGTELWDFSLVDPDNRRPVDYDRRAQLLAGFPVEAARMGPPGLARSLAESLPDGRAKLYLTATALRCRRDHPGLFAEGEYLPADVVGSRHHHVVALVRRHGEQIAVAAAPRLLAGLLDGRPAATLGAEVWQDTALLFAGVPAGARLRNLFTGEILAPGAVDDRVLLPASEVFRDFPVALFLVER